MTWGATAPKRARPVPCDPCGAVARSTVKPRLRYQGTSDRIAPRIAPDTKRTLCWRSNKEDTRDLAPQVPATARAGARVMGSHFLKKYWAKRDQHIRAGGEEGNELPSACSCRDTSAQSGHLYHPSVCSWCSVGPVSSTPATLRGAHQGSAACRPSFAGQSTCHREACSDPLGGAACIGTTCRSAFELHT